YNSLPAVTPLKMSEEEHCYMFLYPIIHPFFLGPQKEYKLLLNHSTGGSRQRPDFACVVGDIPILISEIKPLGYTPLQQRKDNLRIQLQARKYINQQLWTKLKQLFLQIWAH
ncbi:2_t:CDS:2, partial [Paraglomus brasilianum]